MSATASVAAKPRYTLPAYAGGVAQALAGSAKRGLPVDHGELAPPRRIPVCTPAATNHVLAGRAPPGCTSGGIDSNGRSCGPPPRASVGGNDGSARRRGEPSAGAMPRLTRTHVRSPGVCMRGEKCCLSVIGVGWKLRLKRLGKWGTLPFNLHSVRASFSAAAGRAAAVRLAA